MSSWYEVKLAYQARLGVVKIRHSTRAAHENHAIELVLEHHGLADTPHLSSAKKVRRPVSSRIVKTIAIEKTLEDIEPSWF